MRIKTKLIFAFMIVGILPMLAAVYLSITIISNKLNEKNDAQLLDTVEFIKSREQQTFDRTLFGANKLAYDKDFLSNLSQFQQAVITVKVLSGKEDTPQAILAEQKSIAETKYLAIKNIMKNAGNQLQEIEFGVKDIEVLDRDQLLTYVNSTSELEKKQNPIWQGYTYTTTEKGETGIMATSVVKMEYEGRILGGIQTGIFIKESLIDVIGNFYPGVNSLILEPNFTYPKNDPENTRLNNEVFKKGLFYSTERIERNHIPMQAQCLPLKGPHDKVLGGIFLAIPRSTITEVWSNNRNLIMGLMIGVCSGLAIILGYLIARGISSPIRRLVKGVEEISKGNLDHRIRIRSKDEMKDLADAFNNMTEELALKRKLESQIYSQDKLASLGQLSAGIAHEIRNPLGSIKSYAGILKDSLLKEGKEREIAQIISDQVDRLNVFITDFLNFAKTQEPRIVPSSLEPLLERTVKLVQTQYPKEKYPIEFSPQSQNAIISIDPQQMEQVFLNLIINAIQAMPNGGLLKISYIPNQETKTIDVILQDSGKGISEDDLKNIFKPFFTTRSDGTGLGLWIVHQIIERHHGKIDVKSSVGKGTRITVSLPIAEKKS